jgi:hypothetical protein
MDFGQLLSGITQYGTGPMTTMADFGAAAPGAAPKTAAGGGFNWNWDKLGGALSAANLGLGMVGMANTARSQQGAFNTGGIFKDIGLGENLYALNKDISEQRLGQLWKQGFTANNPYYKQNVLSATLPDLAGRYGRFGAFLAG